MTESRRQDGVRASLIPPLCDGGPRRERRDGRPLSFVFVLFVQDTTQEHRDRDGRTENTTSRMVCSLTHSNKPEVALPDDVRVGGRAIGGGARGWGWGWVGNEKERKGGYCGSTQYCGDIESDRATERLSD